jgi:sporulation protein YlmC with PRC-barrel domain
MMDAQLHRQVVDWDGRPVGWVRESLVHPRTGTVRSLLVNLGPEARATLGTAEVSISIPAHLVATMRRDQVELGVRLPQLARPPLPMPAPPVAAPRLPPA